MLLFWEILRWVLLGAALACDVVIVLGRTTEPFRTFALSWIFFLLSFAVVWATPVVW